MPRDVIEIIATVGGGTLVIAILCAFNSNARQLLWELFGRSVNPVEPPGTHADTPRGS